MASKVQTILIVEDDVRMQKVLKRLFASEGFAVEVASDGLEGLNQFHSFSPSLAILDLMLPQIPGHDLCKRIKKSSPKTPVIILSAITEVGDKVELLQSGADDYVTKPFSPRELLARAQAALRRVDQHAPEEPVRFGDCEVDLAGMVVRKQGDTITLTAHEFKLLRYFLDNSERVISRAELLTDVWGYNHYPTTRSVDNQILKLRQKLEPDPASPRYFLTVHGAGYKFHP